MSSPSHHEQLSALIDGALGRSESAFLLRRLEHDEALRGCYERYHLIGDCLRGQRSATPAPLVLAERIREAVAAESAPRRQVPWQLGMRWAAGFATAAIVATSAFWYVQPQQGDPALTAATTTGVLDERGAAEVASSGVRADDLRRQLPLLPVSARSSRPVGGEFAPTPGPEAWQQAPVTSLHYPSTQYIIVLPAGVRPAQPATEQIPEATR